MLDDGTWDSTPPGDGPREKHRLHQARLTGVVRELAKSPDGQYFLRWLMGISGALQASFPPDHAQAAFGAGKRVIGLSVLSLCAAAQETSFLFNEEVNNG